MDVHISWATQFRSLCKDLGINSLDRHYMHKRFLCEGVKFLTKTLPELAKSVLRSLELGYFDRPTHFAWHRRTLRNFRFALNRIFDPSSGRVLDNPDPLAIWQIRQLAEYVYKLALDFSDEVVESELANYVDQQSELKAQMRSLDGSWLDQLRKNAETFYPSLFKATESQILECGPRPGPGAFFESEKIQGRFSVPWYVFKRLPNKEIGSHSNVFSSSAGFFKPYPSTKGGLRSVIKQNECTLVLVPKDARGPRKIAKYPYHSILASMAGFKWMSKELERVTQHRVNFEDQSINRRLAREGSLDGSIATLDLKDASDRITTRVVRHLFQNASGIRMILGKTRATHVILPDGRKVELTTSTTMGHGMTFPVLAFLCHLSASTRVSKRLGIPFKDAMKRIYVYGDDILCPREWAETVIEGLELTGLKVNKEKSYYRPQQHSFRESCGGDFFMGNEVTPVRFKLSSANLPTPDRAHWGAIVSEPGGVLQIVKHAQELRKNGLLDTASYLETKLEDAGVPMPYVGDGSAALGKWTWDSTLIQNQSVDGFSRYGDGHWDGYVNALTASAISIKSSKVCSLKRLATAFTRPWWSASNPSIKDGWKQLFGAQTPLDFEEVDKPRAVRLTPHWFSISELQSSPG